jgi:hypothetical protein
VLAAALLLAGLLALDRQQPALAAATLTLAGLAREPSLIVPLALAAVWATDAICRRFTVVAMPGRPGMAASATGERSRIRVVTFAVPVGIPLAWQVVLWRAWGVAPLAQGSDRLGLPFAGIWQFARGALQFGTFPLVVRLAELVFVVAAALATAWSLHRSTALRHEKLAWALGLLVVVLLSRTCGSRSGPSCAPSPNPTCWEPLCCWADPIGAGCPSSPPAPSCACRSPGCTWAACNQPGPHDP